jgi:diphthamide synthase subunit DPH2
MIGVAVAKPDRRVAYIAPTFQQARDIAWEMLKSRVQPIAIDTNESQLKITVRTKGDGKSTITLKS